MRDTVVGTPANQATGGAPFSQTWSFAIPNQVYVQNNGIDFPSDWTFSAQTDPMVAGDVDTFSTPNASTWMHGQPNPIPLTAAQIGDINAAAGGTLTTTFAGTLNNYVTIFSVTIHIARSSAVTLPMPWEQDEIIQQAAVVAAAQQYGRVEQRQRLAGALAEIHAGSQPPASVLDTISYLRFSQERDNIGAAWNKDIPIADGVDPLSAAGCELGNGYGVLYSVAGKFNWLFTPNPDKWNPAFAVAVSGIGGQCYGMAKNDANTLCALVGTKAVVSRDRGKTWAVASTPPMTDPTAHAPSITSIRHMFIIIQPDGTIGNPTFYISQDGAQTWK